MWDEEGCYEKIKCHGKRSINNKSSFKNKKNLMKNEPVFWITNSKRFPKLEKSKT